MKLLTFALLTVVGIGAAACSKEQASPADDATDLKGSTWRMTGYTMEFGALNSAARTTNNFFINFSYPSGPPCLGLNTFEFTAAGKVLWTSEVGGCSIRSNFVNSEWGTWSVNAAQTQLTVYSPWQGAGQSAIPVVYPVQGAYDYELNATTLSLTTKRIYGRLQDSVSIERAVFTRQ